MKLIINNCTIVSEGFNENIKYCIVIIDKKITQIVPATNSLLVDDYKIIDAQGLYVCPGFIDMHCHLRQPGFEYKEDIESGTAAAAAGGYTSVVAMANTNPVTDSAEKIKNIYDIAKIKASANVLQVGAVTKNLLGAELTDFESLKDAGAIALSDDGKPITDTKIMLEALKLAKSMGLSLISHCEVPEIAKGVMNRGKIAKELHLEGIPNAAEDIMIARDCILSYEYNLPIHIAHISTKTGVAIVRYYKALGAPVTAETCPHYFSLTEDDVKEYGANAKMNPPLRTEQDRLAIIEGIKDGTIDCIVTDHAPHSKEEKERGLKNAPNGIVGLETAFTVSNTYLVQEGAITLKKLITMLTTKPAEILKIDKGIFKNGADADIVLINPDEKIKVHTENFKSKGKNTPFDGYKLFGKVYMTICGGKITYKG